MGHKSFSSMGSRPWSLEWWQLVNLKRGRWVRKGWETLEWTVTVRPHCILRVYIRWGMAFTSVCVSVWAPTHMEQRPHGESFFPLSVLYKQIELEKSSQWNIILTSNLWVFSQQLVIASLFNQSEHKGPNHQTCCEQTTIKAMPRLDGLITGCQPASGSFSWALTWQRRTVLTVVVNKQ